MEIDTIPLSILWPVFIVFVQSSRPPSTGPIFRERFIYRFTLGNRKWLDGICCTSLVDDLSSSKLVEIVDTPIRLEDFVDVRSDVSVLVDVTDPGYYQL
jgi:hypothetical protein